MTLRELLDAWQRLARPTTLGEPLDEALRKQDNDALKRLADHVSVAALVDPPATRALLGGRAAAIDAAVESAGNTRLAIADLRNALACVGATVDEANDRVLKTWFAGLSPSPHVGFAALALDDIVTPRLIAEVRGPIGFEPRQQQFDDLTSFLGHLLGVFRYDAGEAVALAAWSWLERQCIEPEVSAALVLWVARIVHRGVCEQPVGSVAAWAHDSLWAHVAHLEAHSERQREELLADRTRLDAEPGATLRSWEQSSKSIVALTGDLAASLEDDRALAELANGFARSVLVEPDQAHDTAANSMRLLESATPQTPRGRLAVLDLANALGCVGAEPSPAFRERVCAWLPELVSLGPPLGLYVRVGLAALCLDRMDVARTIAEPAPVMTHAIAEAPRDMLALLGELVRWSAEGVTFGGNVEGRWRQFGEQLTPLCSDGQLDEATVLWLGRVTYAHFSRRPVGQVARRVHDSLWRIPEDLKQAQAEAAARPLAFPLGETFGDRAFRVDEHVMGRGVQQLYLGHELVTGRELLAAFDHHSPRKHDVGALRQLVSYRIPGVFDLAYIGAVERPGHGAQWTMIELATEGSWLPRILGPAEPWTTTRKAIELGVSAGQILVRAARAGVLMTEIRPELMWAVRRDGHIAVTGLSTRAMELFNRKSGDMGSYEIFDRYYHAPEVYRDPDDRAVAYALAVMIAEWAGQYPFASRDRSNTVTGVRSARHEPLRAPAPLAKLLERTIRFDRAERPRLTELVAELERLG